MTAKDPKRQATARLATEDTIGSTRPEVDPPVSRIGRTVGRYEIKQEVARGSMGVVYKAWDPHLSRDVAIKVLLKPVVRGTEPYERFRREANASAGLRHPNAVAVHDHGVDRGYPYLVMALVEGGSLNHRLRRQGSFEPREAARVMGDVARATHCAHSQGLLHRDIKPANVLLTDEGVALLTDFGLVKSIESPDEKLTATGQLIGTPAFMSPEQAIGIPGTLDARSDVYSLGATLYTLLTGRPPFQSPSIRGMLWLVVEEPVTPPTQLREGLDQRLEAICLKCLEKDPTDRYPSAEALADALGTWLRETDPDALVSPKTSPQLASGAPLGVLHVLAAGALLAVGFLLGLSGEGQAPPELPLTGSSEPARQPTVPLAPKPTPSELTPTPPELTPALELVAGPPPRLPNSELQIGSLVLVALTNRFDGDDLSQLGWVTAVDEERVELLVGGHAVGPVTAPRDGFRRDALGVGARTLLEQGGQPVPCTIHRRKGPVALVEFADASREWVPVVLLKLRGAGENPGDQALVEVVLAPWEENDTLYPVVVVDESANGYGRVRVAYLDRSTAWIERDSLRPLPSPSDRAHYTDSKGASVAAIVVDYPGRWAVRLGNAKDFKRHLVNLHSLNVTKADREE